MSKITEGLIIATSHLVDDGSGAWFAPSHDTITDYVNQCSLTDFDPRCQNPPISTGKRKRIQKIIRQGNTTNETQCLKFINLLIGGVRGGGGLDPESENYRGINSIKAFEENLKDSGVKIEEYPTPSESDYFTITDDKEFNNVLSKYTERAKNADEEQLLGNAKNILEVACKRSIFKVSNYYDENHYKKLNFPKLLTEAYDILNLNHKDNCETIEEKFEKNMYDMAININSIRNLHGDGHGSLRANLVEKEIGKSISNIAFGIVNYMLSKCE